MTSAKYDKEENLKLEAEQNSNRILYIFSISIIFATIFILSLIPPAGTGDEYFLMLFFNQIFGTISFIVLTVLAVKLVRALRKYRKMGNKYSDLMQLSRRPALYIAIVICIAAINFNLTTQDASYELLLKDSSVKYLINNINTEYPGCSVSHIQYSYRPKPQEPGLGDVYTFWLDSSNNCKIKKIQFSQAVPSGFREEILDRY